MLLFVEYTLINFRSTNQNTISTDLLPIRISINNHLQDKQAKQTEISKQKTERESGLNCIKNYASPLRL